MGLYLCVFDGEDEVEGVEVGSYGDFATLRESVRDRLEDGVPGSRFPTLMNHSDCDGTWSPDDAELLQVELDTIADEFSRLPPIPLGDWKRSVARTAGISPASLLDCFFDVDGEPLLDRLRGLCLRSVERGLPILFQ